MNLTDHLPPGTLRADDPDGVMYEAVCQAAWPAFLNFAIDDPGIRADFTAATGMVLLAPARTPLERMIDSATGCAASVADRFVEWVTVEIYGIEAAPAAYRAELVKRRAAREAAP